MATEIDAIRDEDAIREWISKQTDVATLTAAARTFARRQHMAQRYAATWSRARSEVSKRLIELG